MNEAERERLAILAEECGEIVQMVGKILRHGYESYNPNDSDKITNRVRLHEELLDISAVLGEMNERGDIKFQATEREVKDRWKRKLQWTHHQDKVG